MLYFLEDQKCIILKFLNVYKKEDLRYRSFYKEKHFLSRTEILRQFSYGITLI